MKKRRCKTHTQTVSIGDVFYVSEDTVFNVRMYLC